MEYQLKSNGDLINPQVIIDDIFGILLATIGCTNERVEQAIKSANIKITTKQ